MTEFEFKCYGMSEQDIQQNYMQSITAKLTGLEMVAMSVLSDAQEVLRAGDQDQSRKYMNVAKYILSQMMQSRMA